MRDSTSMAGRNFVALAKDLPGLSENMYLVVAALGYTIVLPLRPQRLWQTASFLILRGAAICAVSVALFYFSFSHVNFKNSVNTGEYAIGSNTTK